MFLELLAGTILWTSMDTNKIARLDISCNQVAVHYGGRPQARKETVTFWFEDKTWKHTYLYAIPMPVGSAGQIQLEPTEYWIEELRTRENIKLRIKEQDYIFNLKGTHKAVNCGDVAQ